LALLTTAVGPASKRSKKAVDLARWCVDVELELGLWKGEDVREGEVSIVLSSCWRMRIERCILALPFAFMALMVGGPSSLLLLSSPWAGAEVEFGVNAERMRASMREERPVVMNAFWRSGRWEERTASRAAKEVVRVRMDGSGSGTGSGRRSGVERAWRRWWTVRQRNSACKVRRIVVERWLYEVRAASKALGRMCRSEWNL